MDSEYDYATAILPDITKVLGIRLLPFKVGHALLLKRVQSPFSVGGVITIERLLEAVWICARSYQDGAAGLYSGSSLKLKLWSVGAAIRAQWDKTLLQRHSEAFAIYIEQGHRDPRGIFKPVGGSTTTTPLTLLLIHDLAHNYGWTKEAILEMPMREAKFERWKLLDEKGNLFRDPRIPLAEEKSHAE